MTAPKEFEAAYYAQEHLEAGLVLMELSLHEIWGYHIFY
jgi:hypothetical protein